MKAAKGVRVQIGVYTLSALLTWTAMPVLSQAAGTGSDTNSNVTSSLPSAGIDYILASNGTSLKNLQNEDAASAADKRGEESKSSDSSAQTAAPTGTQKPESVHKEDTEDKEIEETFVPTAKQTTREMEKKIAQKKEEAGFKSLVIADVNDYVNVRSLPSEEGEILGKLYDKSVGTFLSEEDGWYEINSGNVTGYVKAEYCVTGDAAVQRAKEVGTRIATVTTTTLKVREEPGMDKVVLGLVPIEDQLIVTEELDDWVKVNIEEGDGYVSLDFVKLSTEFIKAESKAEEEARLAKEKAEREAAQAAARKTQQSSSDGKSSGKNYSPAVTSGSGSELGRSVANFAKQFVGNPYVYGGTSLTNGADCSGFVMSVYANFGVSLPHSSAADRNVGSAVSGLENAQPGDIICYSGHVGIYVGDGNIVHASTAKTGIKISNASYRSILSIRRIF